MSNQVGSALSPRWVLLRITPHSLTQADARTRRLHVHAEGLTRRRKHPSGLTVAGVRACADICTRVWWVKVRNELMPLWWAQIKIKCHVLEGWASCFVCERLWCIWSSGERREECLNVNVFWCLFFFLFNTILNKQYKCMNDAVWL